MVIFEFYIINIDIFKDISIIMILYLEINLIFLSKLYGVGNLDILKYYFDFFILEIGKNEKYLSIYWINHY